MYVGNFFKPHAKIVVTRTGKLAILRTFNQQLTPRAVSFDLEIATKAI